MEALIVMKIFKLVRMNLLQRVNRIMVNEMVILIEMEN